jgi:hypothetical protein
VTTTPLDDDFVDISIVPPTLLVEACAAPVGDETRTLAVPPALVAEALT